jgi:hypothetical protein|tara:strand:+ start:66 stop:431 length:366 start_codon:yes stop_codon:yes gene_type:complete
MTVEKESYEIFPSLEELSDGLRRDIELFISDETKHNRGPLTQSEKDRICWDLREEEMYPEEYIIYKEKEVMEEDEKRLARKYLMHSPDWATINEYLERLDREEMKSISIHYKDIWNALLQV